MKNVMCTCGGKCDGVCRNQNLHRKRVHLDICPSAYFEDRIIGVSCIEESWHKVDRHSKKLRRKSEYA